MCLPCAGLPSLDKELRDQKIISGEQFKLKLPVSGTGPFEFKLKKNGREIEGDDRLKFSPFDDFVVLNIKGE